MLTAMERVTVNEIIELFKARFTYQQISEFYKERFPGIRGFSVPAIKLFCKREGISPRINKDFVSDAVREAVEEVILYIFF